MPRRRLLLFLLTFLSLFFFLLLFLLLLRFRPTMTHISKQYWTIFYDVASTDTRCHAPTATRPHHILATHSDTVAVFWRKEWQTANLKRIMPKCILWSIKRNYPALRRSNEWRVVSKCSVLFLPDFVYETCLLLIYIVCVLLPFAWTYIIFQIFKCCGNSKSKLLLLLLQPLKRRQHIFRWRRKCESLLNDFLLFQFSFFIFSCVPAVCVLYVAFSWTRTWQEQRIDRGLGGRVGGCGWVCDWFVYLVFLANHADKPYTNFLAHLWAKILNANK